MRMYADDAGIRRCGGANERFERLKGAEYEMTGGGGGGDGDGNVH